ncbi:MAG: hypothetical protein E6I04_11110 [Chloroflexi bacterium]|nr:MAG: hypothetical protein E6I92_12030 [Chloroflexota bacterium]TMF95882.1 MAG: hypothetical protein E6I04_11110 [Chloroflexota bacterium]
MVRGWLSRPAFRARAKARAARRSGARRRGARRERRSAGWRRPAPGCGARQTASPRRPADRPDDAPGRVPPSRARPFPPSSSPER